MHDLQARGRNPHKSLREIVCWQFEEFFMPYGMLKTAFPFELQQDIAALAEVMNGLRSITILGSQSQTWGFPPFLRGSGFQRPKKGRGALPGRQ